MDPPAFNLNWMLLPYDQRISRRPLRFNMAFPVDRIAFRDRGSLSRASDAELDTPAADGFITKMFITFERGPFKWEVNVESVRGIRCRDVFEAIYRTFNVPLTLKEQALVGDPQTVEQAFQLRCKIARDLAEVERSRGWKRVDILLRRTIFLGLTQRRPGHFVLNLGSALDVPALSVFSND